MVLNADNVLLNLDLLRLTLNLKQRLTFLLKMKGVGIHRSLVIIDRSFTSEPQMLQELFSFLLEQRWSCLEITLSLRLN